MDERRKRPKVCIVGGVAGGGSAATRLRRLAEHAEIVLFERGPVTSYATCGLPYYLGNEIARRDALLVAGERQFCGWFGVDLRINSEVRAIDREAQTVEVCDLSNNRCYRETYDYLILSPGAAPIYPASFPEHSRITTLRTLADIDRIKGVVDQGAQSVVIVGAGFIGLELMEALAGRGVKVTLIEALAQVMPAMDAELVAPVHQVIAQHGVDLLLEQKVTAIDAIDAQRLEVTLASGARRQTELVILSMGVRPESALAKEAGLTLTPRGAICVDEHLLTNDPRIYAVGDAVEVTEPVLGGLTYVPLAGPANRQGRLAADHIAAREGLTERDPRQVRFGGMWGTGICRVFELVLAGTGRNQRALAQAGMVLHEDFEVVTVHPFDHASYYPGAARLTLKLMFAKPSGRILGAQAVGEKGVDKRIDVLAMAIQRNATVYDLEEVELCYAPPFGSAKDPVNMAGFQAVNILRGLTVPLTAAELLTQQATEGPGPVLLDVRTAEEVNRLGAIAGAIHIPLHDLRSRLDELPRDRQIVTYCAVGLRGYIAARLLSQQGFDRVQNLLGGYTSWQQMQAAAPRPTSR